MSSESGGPDWFTSTYSQHGGECVEVAHFGNGAIGVRDSKDRTGPTLSFTPSEWDAFTADIQAGRFTPPTA
ncbi:DUF397 domain-containing protein [Nocardia veterana]|uniref:DUF397 domain-containing protein n=1 Tax=Nocardia veterana TaxID=132249 RepID=A0A7X6M2G2_9NOCA|nr:DUF397 domain-containing protein [Nocardia veterana]NKY88982.1 DUF397 domain-containing protein [Nocardia veterana]